MGLNGVEVSPHGLIFDVDGATGCTTPPEALPTSFKAILSQFESILSRFCRFCRIFSIYIPLIGVGGMGEAFYKSRSCGTPGSVSPF